MYSPDEPKARENWLKLSEAAVALDCSVDTIRRAIEMREMDVRRAGKRGHFRVEEQELHRWWKGKHRLIKRTSSKAS
jgi:excisionase family DNA binding protein